ncbi:MAG: DUF933 domain-containing protein [Desulfovibrionaceae bacterium]
MRTAIFGFSGSGVSELFAALAGPKAAAAGARAMSKVPEPRLDPLIALFTPKKITYSEIEFIDTPGGGTRSGGLGERTLVEVRSADCLLGVLDAFSGLNDPAAQMEAIETDFLVADLAVVEKRLERLALDKRKNKDLVAPEEEKALQAVMEVLESERPLRSEPELAQAGVLRGFQFLSGKPVLYAWNLPESEVAGFTPPEAPNGALILPVAARFEKELAELEDPEEREMFLTDLGISESALNRVIRGVYELLGLISFFTAGDKEVRAWPVRDGAKAPEAAGVIHTDFQKGFIRAEVLGYDDFLKAENFKKAKELGLFRLEGKEYLVKDGDIVEFRFNV